MDLKQELFQPTCCSILDDPCIYSPRQEPQKHCQGLRNTSLLKVLKSPADKLCGQEIRIEACFGPGVYVRKFSTTLADGANGGMVHWSVHQIQLLIGGSRQNYSRCCFRPWKISPKQTKPTYTTIASVTRAVWNTTASYARSNTI